MRAAAPTLEELLLQLGLGDLDLDRLVDLLLVAAPVVGVVLDGRREERVDEGRLAQPGLAGDLSAWSAPRHAARGGHRTMMVKAAPRLATILCLPVSARQTARSRAPRLTSGWAAVHCVSSSLQRRASTHVGDADGRRRLRRRLALGLLSGGASHCDGVSASGWVCGCD